jgi:hypothetical protein
MEQRGRSIPTPRSAVARFKPVLAAWSELARAGYVDFKEGGVSDLEFDTFCRATGGGHLPRELRALYEISRSGFDVDDDSLRIDPWPPDEATESGIQEQDDFALPEQMYVFGGSMGYDIWTFWLQRGGRERSPSS